MKATIESLVSRVPPGRVVTNSLSRFASAIPLFFYDAGAVRRVQWHTLCHEHRPPQPGQARKSDRFVAHSGMRRGRSGLWQGASARLCGEGVVARAHEGAAAAARGSRRLVPGEVSLPRWRSCGRRRVEAHGDEDVADGLELGDEGDPAERPSAPTAQDVDLIDTF